jgi:cell division protein FtsB
MSLRPGPEEARVEELLRVNAALLAEISNLTAGRADAPRPAAMPTSRRLAALIDEREDLREQLGEFGAEAEALRAERDALRRRGDSLEAEILRLRAGLGGALRRVTARLLGPSRR